MRGRTDDAFVILDEAQNTTTQQEDVLTRLGFGSQNGCERRRDTGQSA